MSLLDRRLMMLSSSNEDDFFEYMGEYQFQSMWESVNISMKVEDNSLYIIIPKDDDYIKYVVIGIFNGKYGFISCGESTKIGCLHDAGYTLTDNTVTINTKIGDRSYNKIVTFDVYRRSFG